LDSHIKNSALFLTMKKVLTNIKKSSINMNFPYWLYSIGKNETSFVSHRDKESGYSQKRKNRKKEELSSI
jgi:hypothetical protein